MNLLFNQISQDYWYQMFERRLRTTVDIHELNCIFRVTLPFKSLKEIILLLSKDITFDWHVTPTLHNATEALLNVKMLSNVSQGETEVKDTVNRKPTSRSCGVPT